MKPLDKICEVHGRVLDKYATWMDGEVCLKAVASVESSYGIYNVPKHEKAYDQGGIYFNRSLWAKYGSVASCSYSSWQLMFPVAVELGFLGTPFDLMKDEIAIYWVIEYIKRRILDKGCTNLKDFADAYNSGSFKDQIIPTEYINKFIHYYQILHAEKYGEKA